MQRLHIIAVSSILKREQLVNKIYENLVAKNHDAKHILILKDRINRIKILHDAGNGVQIEIKSILFLVLPIMVNLAPLDNFEGDLFFDLDDLIVTLEDVIARLRSKSGKHLVRRTYNAEAKRLVTDIPDFYV